MGGNLRGGLLLLLAVATLNADGAFAERRALVVGIDDYRDVTDLTTARNDAKAVGKTLKRIGFDVVLLLDPERRELNRALAEFAGKLGRDDDSLIYFAGHGVEIDGRNYLLPSDVPEVTEGDSGFLRSESVAVDQVIDTIAASGVRISVLILDACRDNPFSRGGTRSVGALRGLAPIYPPKGTLILYSAKAGETALDRLSKDDPIHNSVFTRALLPLMTEPGLNHRDLAARLRHDVTQLATSVGHDQFPSYYDEIEGDFIFVPASSQQGSATPDLPRPSVVSSLAELSPACEPTAKDKMDAASETGSLVAVRDWAQGCPEPEASKLARLALTSQPAAGHETPPYYSAGALSAAVARPDKRPTIGGTAPFRQSPSDTSGLPAHPGDIKPLQTALHDRGCYSGSIDGLLGKSSRAAVGVFADGVGRALPLGTPPTLGETERAIAAIHAFPEFVCAAANSTAKPAEPKKVANRRVPDRTASRTCITFEGSSKCY